MESRSIADETFLVRKLHPPAFDLDVDWSDGRRWKEASNSQGEGRRGGDEDEDVTVDDEEQGGEGEAAEGAGKEAQKDGLIEVTGKQRTSTRMRGGNGDRFVAVMGDEVSELMSIYGFQNPFQKYSNF